jgi:hypothetical protein
MHDKNHREGSSTQPIARTCARGTKDSDDIIATKGALEDGLAFISKPIKPYGIIEENAGNTGFLKYFVVPTH